MPSKRFSRIARVSSKIALFSKKFNTTRQLETKRSRFMRKSSSARRRVRKTTPKNARLKALLNKPGKNT